MRIGAPPPNLDPVPTGYDPVEFRIKASGEFYSLVVSQSQLPLDSVSQERKQEVFSTILSKAEELRAADPTLDAGSDMAAAFAYYALHLEELGIPASAEGEDPNSENGQLRAAILGGFLQAAPDFVFAAQVSPEALVRLDAVALGFMASLTRDPQEFIDTAYGR